MISVFDFFCGCGGAAAGLRQAGMRIAYGVDVAPDAVESFRMNFPEAEAETADVRNTDPGRIRALAGARGGTVLFSGCPPCQPFTRQNGSGCRPDGDPRGDLIEAFTKLVTACLPDLVFLENVPGLRKERAGGRLGRFLQALTEAGYGHDHAVVRSCEYGVPQMRRRLVVLAARGRRVALPEPGYGPGTGHPEYPAAGEVLARYPALEAGQRHPSVPDHEAAELSEENLERIRATPPGGGRRQTPMDMRTPGHRRTGGWSDVRGRMRPDRPASGLTTRFGSFSNGRFGHPEQNRAISIREGAALQGFADGFRFSGTATGRIRQIGNAVPVLLAQRMGEALVRSLKGIRTP